MMTMYSLQRPVRLQFIYSSSKPSHLFPFSGKEFQPTFPSTAKHIYRQLLRVFAHIYYAHYTQILHLRTEPHFNSLFAHFLAFGKEYELLDVKDVKGSGNGYVAVGELWEKWKDMGILESTS